MANGEWLDGLEWTDGRTNANMNTPGRTDSFLKGSHVKRI